MTRLESKRTDWREPRRELGLGFITPPWRADRPNSPARMTGIVRLSVALRTTSVCPTSVSPQPGRATANTCGRGGCRTAVLIIGRSLKRPIMVVDRRRTRGTCWRPQALVTPATARCRLWTCPIASLAQTWSSGQPLSVEEGLLFATRCGDASKTGAARTIIPLLRAGSGRAGDWWISRPGCPPVGGRACRKPGIRSSWLALLLAHRLAATLLTCP